MDGLNSSVVLWRGNSNGSSGSKKYRTMTVQFEIAENPIDGIYLDDAINCISGKGGDSINFWQEFFGYKPCLFKNGKVVGYLNPNDYTKFEDETAADITSGDAGDVMVEFPRRGIKISKSGTTVTVSMTDNPDDPDFTYYAHTRGSIRKNYFYVGAYYGYDSNNKLRSLSGKYFSVSSDWTIGWSTYRTHANNLGTNYTIMTYYQYVFIQCMYLLQFKGFTNSQQAVGNGCCVASYLSDSGSCDTNGLIYGVSNSLLNHMKLFGIEDLWGYAYCFIDGIKETDSKIYTATDNFENSDNYNLIGNYPIQYMVGTNQKEVAGIIMDLYADSEVGFIPCKSDYHLTNPINDDSYICDYGRRTGSSRFIIIGYDCTYTYNEKYAKEAGIFKMTMQYNVPSHTYARLAYL